MFSIARCAISRVVYRTNAHAIPLRLPPRMMKISSTWPCALAALPSMRPSSQRLTTDAMPCTRFSRLVAASSSFTTATYAA